MSNRVVMMYWDCPSCGRKHIEGLTHDCPSCGRQRGESTRFYLDNGKKKYVDHKVIGADWYCEYCNSLNPATLDKCENCGSPRSESTKNYFDFKNNDRSLKSTNNKDYLIDKIVENENKDEEENIINDDNKNNTSSSIINNISNISINTDILLGIFVYSALSILVIFIVIFLFKFFSPRQYEFEVTEVGWKYSIDIEYLKTFREDDWSIPIGGREVYTRQEIHHYEKEIDYYKDVQKSRQVEDGGHYENVTRTRQVQDGYDVSYSYIENGDGTATEIEHTTPRYKTETYTDKVYVKDYKTEYYTEKEPVYKDVPVYKTKYYYDIDRWVFEKSIISTGTDKNPYYKEYSLNDKERESSRNTYYYMSGIQKGRNMFGKYKIVDKTYSLSYDEFMEINNNDILSIVVKGNAIDSYNIKDTAKIYDFNIRKVA